MTTKIPPVPELDYQIVMDALRSYAFPRKALSDALSRGELTRVKKGLYVQSGPGIEPYSREVLANMIYGPSYISYEYALSYYGLIPERVEEVTCVTTGKTKRFDTPVGRFTYRHQNAEYYNLGYGRRQLDGRRWFLIAQPEKALTDRVLVEGGRFSRRSMEQLLIENLRLDEDELGRLDRELLGAICRRGKRRSLETLYAFVEELS